MRFIRTISSLVLALLVLISSTSFMVGMHFCMDQVQSVALSSKAQACEREQSIPPCHRQTDPCCEDEAVFHDADDFKTGASKLQVNGITPVVVLQPLILISQIVAPALALRDSYFNYDPPLPACDLTVRHRVFLI